jgi:hypothetical protein
VSEPTPEIEIDPRQSGERRLTDRYRAQQRRRAVIAWSTAILFVALFVAGAIVGGGETQSTAEHPEPFGYTMTAKQYAALRSGLDETRFVDRLEQTGLPENLTKRRFVALFPPHGDGITCSYWDIAQHPELVARVCFSSSAGRLVQKLERSAAASFGANA